MPLANYSTTILITVVLLTWTWASATADSMDTVRANEDLIVSLPGLEVDPPFRQYSGYLKATGTRRLHYWLIESEGSVADDPLVIWFNGGPGCSSLTGLLEGNGPFRVAPDGVTMVTNPDRWNRVVSMLYIESPAGTGFSYSTDANYTTSNEDARDNKYAAILNFFERFPGFADNDLYIFGQSWGGVYVPMLADLIVNNSDINLKGIGIGNGYVDGRLMDGSYALFAYSNGFIDDRMWSLLQDDCCVEAVTGLGIEYLCPLNDCPHGMMDIYKMHPYDFNAPCAKPRSCNQSLPLSERALCMGYPCVNSTATIVYLNQESVRHALHIPSELPGMKEWYMCGRGQVQYIHSGEISMGPYFHRILDKGKRVLLYFGTADLVCSFFGGRWFTASLELPLVSSRRPWFFENEHGQQQLAGFRTRYDHLDFVTVTSASHMVPNDKGREAFQMLQTFLDEEEVDN